MTESTVDGVRYAADGPVATLTFDKPDRSNAMDVPMQVRYGGLLRQADADPGVRAVVVTGAGKAFCPGADLGLLDDLAAAPRRPEAATRTSATSWRPRRWGSRWWRRSTAAARAWAS